MVVLFFVVDRFYAADRIVGSSDKINDRPIDRPTDRPTDRQAHSTRRSQEPYNYSKTVGDTQVGLSWWIYLCCHRSYDDRPTEF